MKIAFILPSLANKGPIIMARTLISQLISMGTPCDAYYFDDLIELDFPCTVRKIGFFEPINFQSYSVIHSHLFRPDVYCAYHKKRILKSGAKVLTTIHTAIYQDLRYTYHAVTAQIIIAIWERAWKKFDHAVVLTETAKAYYQHIHFPGLTVINNGIDPPRQDDPLTQGDMEVINSLKKYTLLGTVCAIDARKGLEQVVTLLAAQPQYAFLVVGDGVERAKLEQLASKFGVNNRFRILGFRKDGYRYLSYFDQFIIPSRSEGMPLALLEAMALSIPIVASRIPAFTTNFSEQELNYFDLDDTISLNDACAQACSLDNKKEAKAFLHYEKAHTAIQMARKYLICYQCMSKNY